MKLSDRMRASLGADWLCFPIDAWAAEVAELEEAAETVVTWWGSGLPPKNSLANDLGLALRRLRDALAKEE